MQFKQSKFNVATKVLRNKSKILKAFYGLAKTQTFFQRFERQ